MLRKLLIFTLLVVPGMLMADTGDIPLSSNFQLNSGKPLDARIRAADLTARNAIAGVQRYDGLLVYQIDTKRTWQLQGDTNTWVDVTNGSSGTVTTATAQQLAYYPNNGIQIAGATNVTTDGSTLTVTGSAVFSNGLSSGAWDIAEGISPGGAVGGQSIWADSTTHTLQVNPNNAGDHAVVLSSITPVTNGLAVWKGYGKMGDMGLPPWAVVPSTFAWTLPYPVALSSSVVITGASTTITAPLSIVGFSTETISNEYFDLSQSSAAVGFIKAGVTYGIAGQVLTSGGSTSSATWTTPSSGSAGLLAVGVDTGSIRSSLNSEISAVGTDTTTLKSNILSVGLDTATLKTGLLSVGVDTASLKTGLVAVGVDTASLKTITVAIGVDTTTISNNYPVSLSTGAIGTLAAAQEPAHTGDVTNSAGSLAMTAAQTQANIKTFTAPLTMTASTTLTGVYVSSGITFAINEVIPATTTIVSSMTIIVASCTTRGASPNAWITITLPPASSNPGEYHEFYSVGADSCSIRVAGNGSDLIESSGVFRLDAQGQHGYIRSLGNGKWAGNIQYTPWSVFTTQDDVGTFTVASSSLVYSFPVYIPVPVAVMGFRFNRTSNTGWVSTALTDMNGRYVVGVSTQLTISNPTNYMTGGVTQVPPGWYRWEVTANNTLVTLTASNTSAGQHIFGSTVGTNAFGLDLSQFVPTLPGSANSNTYPAIDLIINGGLQGF